MARKLLLGVLFFAFAFLLGAHFLPREIVVERSRAIAASPEAVFPYLNDLEQFQRWSPWAARDPAMEVTYGEKRAGVGASVRWRSERPDVGAGAQRIVQSVPLETVVADLTYGSEDHATSYLAIAPEDGGVIVTWGFELELGSNPLERWAGLGMDGLIGADYEKGLARLAALVEG